MRDKGLSVVIAIGVIVFAIMFSVTNGFSSQPDQSTAYISDVTVRSVAPTVNDDIDFGFRPGYIWVDQVGGAIYVIEDITDGAAVWTDVTAGGSTFNSEELDALVTANVNILDFGLGFDLTDSPAGETNVTLDYTEDPVNLSGAEVTGTLDLSDHVNLAAGTGATLTGDSLSVDLGVAIDTSEITDGTILEADLNATNAPTDGFFPSYDSGSGGFTWEAGAGGGGGSGTLTTIKDSTVQVGDADIVALDFGTGITCSESPDTEVNCSADLGTDIDLTSEVTGTLPAANGGTGQTAATADGVLVANGSAYVVRVVPDCNTAGNALNYDQTTDAWSCRTGYLTTVDISTDTNLAAGTGATLTGDTISVDLGTAIDTTEVTDDSLLEADLDAVDTPVDEECLTYESGAGGDFEWQTCGAGGGTESLFGYYSTNTLADLGFVAGCRDDCAAGNSSQNGYLPADTIIALPFYIANDVTMDAFAFFVNTAGAAGEDARFGIYNSASDIEPDTLLVDCGTVAIDATGYTSATCSQALTGGNWYFFAYVTESSTFTIRRGTSNSYEGVLGREYASNANNRHTVGYHSDHTCGTGCATSLPDPFPTTNQDIFNSISQGAPAWILLDLG